MSWTFESPLQVQQVVFEFKKKKLVKLKCTTWLECKQPFTNFFAFNYCDTIENDDFLPFVSVVERFSSVKLVADVKIETNDDQSMNSEEVSKGMEELSVGPSLGGASSGAVGKFKKKEKKKKNKKRF